MTGGRGSGWVTSRPDGAEIVGGGGAENDGAGCQFRAELHWPARVATQGICRCWQLDDVPREVQAWQIIVITQSEATPDRWLARCILPNLDSEPGGGAA